MGVSALSSQLQAFMAEAKTNIDDKCWTANLANGLERLSRDEPQGRESAEESHALQPDRKRMQLVKLRALSQMDIAAIG
jgi:hypothetical protein